MLKLGDIWLRDPFVFTRNEGDTDPRLRGEEVFVLFGTTDVPPGDDVWGEFPARGFSCFASGDLESWRGPIEAFVRPAEFWADTQFWAPEVYRFVGTQANSVFVMVASCKSTAKDGVRAVQIFVAEFVTGPYAPLYERPISPPSDFCLDGTFYFEEVDSTLWLVYCKEWLQVQDGEIWAVPLEPDLKSYRSEPVLLFAASSAPWTRPISGRSDSQGQCYVTDGPFIHFAAGTRELIMLWSSIGTLGRYMIGVSRSLSGKITGPWIHDPTPLFEHDGGHPCLFLRPKSGPGASIWSPSSLYIAFHTPNKDVLSSRPIIFPVKECIKNGCQTTFQILF